MAISTRTAPDFMVCSMSRVTSFGAAAPGTRTAPIRRSARLTIWRIASFDAGERAISLSRVGYLYVPTSCAAAQCRLHVAFHGCRQDLASIHDDFIRDAGYNRWAASNGI